MGSTSAIDVKYLVIALLVIILAALLFYWMRRTCYNRNHEGMMVDRASAYDWEHGQYRNLRRPGTEEIDVVSIQYDIYDKLNEIGNKMTGNGAPPPGIIPKNPSPASPNPNKTHPNVVPYDSPELDSVGAQFNRCICPGDPDYPVQTRSWTEQF
jgi:hypothetical protein